MSQTRHELLNRLSLSWISKAVISTPSLKIAPVK